MKITPQFYKYLPQPSIPNSALHRTGAQGFDPHYAPQHQSLRLTLATTFWMSPAISQLYNNSTVELFSNVASSYSSVIYTLGTPALVSLLMTGIYKYSKIQQEKQNFLTIQKLVTDKLYGLELIQMKLSNSLFIPNNKTESFKGDTLNLYKDIQSSHNDIQQRLYRAHESLHTIKMEFSKLTIQLHRSNSEIRSLAQRLICLIDFLDEIQYTITTTSEKNRYLNQTLQFAEKSISETFPVTPARDMSTLMEFLGYNTTPLMNHVLAQFDNEIWLNINKLSFSDPVKYYSVINGLIQDEKDLIKNICDMIGLNLDVIH